MSHRSIVPAILGKINALAESFEKAGAGATKFVLQTGLHGLG